MRPGSLDSVEPVALRHGGLWRRRRRMLRGLGGGGGGGRPLLAGRGPHDVAVARVLVVVVGQDAVRLGPAVAVALVFDLDALDLGDDLGEGVGRGGAVDCRRTLIHVVMFVLLKGK